MIEVQNFQVVFGNAEWVNEQPFGKIPRMTAAEELFWVHEWVEKSFTGRGRILEFGCWLGAVTATILNAANERVIQGRERDTLPHVFDEFIWRQYMVANTFSFHVRNDSLRHYQAGDNFFSEWLRNIGYVNRDRVEVTCGPLEKRDTIYPHPIELAYLDVLKSKQAVHGFASWFLPKVIEGGTIVDQDYYYRIENDTMRFQELFWEFLVESEYVVPVSRCVDSLNMMRTDKLLPGDPVEFSEEINQVMKGVE